MNAVHTCAWTLGWMMITTPADVCVLGVRSLPHTRFCWGVLMFCTVNSVNHTEKVRTLHQKWFLCYKVSCVYIRIWGGGTYRVRETMGPRTPGLLQHAHHTLHITQIIGGPRDSEVNTSWVWSTCCCTQGTKRALKTLSNYMFLVN